MKKEKHLVIITLNFPFGKAESFIEDEIEYYKSFKSVIIVPLSSDGKLRDVDFPGNIKILTLKKSSKLVKSLFFIIALTKKQFWDELKQLFKAKELSFYKIKQAISFIGNGELFTSKIKSKLPKMYQIDETFVFYSYWMLLQSYISIKLAKTFNGRSITRCHGGDLYHERNQEGYLPLRQYLLNNIDEIYCISENGRSYLKSQSYYNGRTLRLSRLGTTDYGIQETNCNRKVLRIVSCSWLVSVKRVELIVEALSEITDFPIEWTHFGDGPQYHKINILAQMKLKNNINWKLAGAVNKKELMKIYKENEYHLFVNVSEFEGVPVSIMEAMSFGIPAIATNVGGTGELVRNLENGILIDKEFCVNGLVKAIEKFHLMTDMEYSEYRIRTREWWNQEYSATINYGELFRELGKI